jgi:hypothetical protein
MFVEEGVNEGDCLWRLSSGKWHRVVRWKCTDLSEELAVAISGLDKKDERTVWSVNTGFANWDHWDVTQWNLVDSCWCFRETCESPSTFRIGEMLFLYVGKCQLGYMSPKETVCFTDTPPALRAVGYIPMCLAKYHGQRRSWASLTAVGYCQQLAWICIDIRSPGLYSGSRKRLQYTRYKSGCTY